MEHVSPPQSERIETSPALQPRRNLKLAARLALGLLVSLSIASDRLDPPLAVGSAGSRVVAVQDAGNALPTAVDMEKLARDNPVAFLEQCLRRYQRDVKGYILLMQKQERINGKILPKEEIEVHYLDKPYSVLFRWREGARLADRVLYVEGENDGKMLAKPKGALAALVPGGVVVRDPDGPEARQSGRYTIKEFGLKKGTERSLVSWKAALESNALQYEYLGIRRVKEAGDRPCWTLRRLCKKLENDGVKEVILYIDTETWLQVGNVLKDEEGLLIGSYFFRDIQLNPTFRKDQFTRAALTQ